MKPRNEVPANLKWRTEDIFATQQAWEDMYEDVSKRLDFSRFEGKLNTVENVKACFDALYDVMGDFELLSVYAHMLHDEDTRKSENNALQARVSALGVRF